MRELKKKKIVNYTFPYKLHTFRYKLHTENSTKLTPKFCTLSCELPCLYLHDNFGKPTIIAFR